MSKRDYIQLRVQLAAALCQIGEIPYEHAKAMTPEQIISLFALDHGIFHAWGGPDEHWNLRWRFRSDHIEKTAKIDIPAIAKSRRITAAQEEFRQRMLAKTFGEPEPIPRKRKRQWPKGTLKSRNNLRRLSRDRQTLET